MSIKSYLLIVCSIVLVAGGCQYGDPVPAEVAETEIIRPAAPESGDKQADICGLLESSEIEKLQADKIIETKPSRQNSDTFIVNHCYYVAGENAKSVVLSVYRADEKNPAGKQPKSFWQEKFAGREKGKDGDKSSKAGSDGKKEKEEWAPPEPVKGLGDQAYWLDNKLGGALYVLKGEEFLRVSVGGTADAKIRISKAKSLAEAALKRM